MRRWSRFPIACFTLALLTDIAYWRTGNLMWQNFSAWLLLAGLVVGVLAALAGAIDLLVAAADARARVGWPHAASATSSSCSSPS